MGKPSGRMLVPVLLTLLGLPATAAVRPSLWHASDGYTYFHHAGADMAAHDAAVDDCARQALTVAAPSLGTASIVGGLAGPAIEALQLKGVMRVYFAANVENCMVSRGWEVVRLGDDEGRALSVLPQPQQAAVLAPLVGSPAPHGEVVRRPAPLGALLDQGGYSDRAGPPSLSLTAGARAGPRPDTPPAATAYRQHAVKPLFAPLPAATPAGASAIVVRMTTIAPHQLPIQLVRLDGPDGAPASLDSLALATPTKAFWKAGSRFERTYVAVVQPGRWRLAGAQGISLCLGGPVFDLAPGEAVFAGSFDAASLDPLIPDLDMEPARVALAASDPALAARLRPADWRAGGPFTCGLLQSPLIWNLDWPARATPDGAPAR